MNIRGIGDTQGFRRLTWLFATTIIAPTLLLSLLAVGAFGQRLLSERELAHHEVRIQLPHLAALLAHHTETLNEQVSILASTCPNTACPPPAGVASWDRTADGVTWEPDTEVLSAWATSRLYAPEAWRGRLLVVQGRTGHPLDGHLSDYRLAQKLDPASWYLDTRAISWLAALLLLALVMTGVVVGLRAAAREMAMSRRQTELVSRISHELRTPLTSIRIFVDTLRDGRLPEDKVAECVDLLAEETSRLSRRLEEVLRWARMEARARRYRVSATPVSEIADEAVVAFRSQVMFEDDQLELVLEVPSDLPPLHVDRDAVVEALVNLLANAFRHTSLPRRIVLSAQQRGLQVGLAVEDNGPGIRRQDRHRIFEKFYRPDNGIGEVSTGGVGLGLAIVRAIVRDHGGSVQLESTPDVGSRFTLWLPTVWARGYRGASIDRSPEEA